jgi:DNA invertase Pin-like site-specific DNA recombinase
VAPPERPGVNRELRGRAAEYVRMSTDHQTYSTANQRAAIAVYAARHGLEVVRTYEAASSLSWNRPQRLTSKTSITL